MNESENYEITACFVLHSDHITSPPCVFFIDDALASGVRFGGLAQVSFQDKLVLCGSIMADNAFIPAQAAFLVEALADA